MINKMRALTAQAANYYHSFKGYIHNNIFLIIGFYGLFLILLLCVCSQFLHINADQVFTQNRLLPPAWHENGDLNHVLGIDYLGRDILAQLLLAFKTTLSITLLITLSTTIIGTMICYLMVFFKPLRWLIKTLFRVITTIPPLLVAIVITFFWGNIISNIMLVIALTILPRFIHNIYYLIIAELNKTYTIAARLDGLSTWGILSRSVFPNIRADFLAEIIVLFSNSLLGITTLTFLGFGTATSYNELGIMMKEMMSIIQINHWAFIAPGLAILITILIVNFLGFGINQSHAHQE